MRSRSFDTTDKFEIGEWYPRMVYGIQLCFLDDRCDNAFLYPDRKWPATSKRLKRSVKYGASTWTNCFKTDGLDWRLTTCQVTAEQSQWRHLRRGGSMDNFRVRWRSSCKNLPVQEEMIREINVLDNYVARAMSHKCIWCTHRRRLRQEGSISSVF